MNQSAFKYTLAFVSFWGMCSLADANMFESAPWFSTVDWGLTSPHTGHAMTVDNGSGYCVPLNVDSFSMRHKIQSILGIQAGKRWQHDQRWLPAHSIGLKYQHLFTQDIHGDITQYSLPEFKNYSYRLGTRADVVSLNGKLNLMTIHRFMPYIDAGLGVSRAGVNHYHEDAFPGVTPRISPDFSSHNQTELYFNAGAGVDVALNPQFIFSVGYDYQSFGRMSSGYGQTTWSSDKLGIGRFEGNTVLLGITYLFA